MWMTFAVVHCSCRDVDQDTRRSSHVGTSLSVTSDGRSRRSPANKSTTSSTLSRRQTLANAAAGPLRTKDIRVTISWYQHLCVWLNFLHDTQPIHDIYLLPVAMSVWWFRAADWQEGHLACCTNPKGSSDYARWQCFRWLWFEPEMLIMFGISMCTEDVMLTRPQVTRTRPRPYLGKAKATRYTHYSACACLYKWGFKLAVSSSSYAVDQNCPSRITNHRSALPFGTKPFWRQRQYYVMWKTCLKFIQNRLPVRLLIWATQVNCSIMNRHFSDSLNIIAKYR